MPNTRGSCKELNIWRHLLKLGDIFHLVEVCQSGWRIPLKSDMVKGNFSSSPDTTSVELDGNDARHLFGEIDCSGTSISSFVMLMLLTGYPYATLKISSPFLFLSVIWFDSSPLIMLASV